MLEIKPRSIGYITTHVPHSDFVHTNMIFLAPVANLARELFSAPVANATVGGTSKHNISLEKQGYFLTTSKISMLWESQTGLGK